MKEFMLLILNRDGREETLPAAQHTAFVKECEVYIEQLKNEGKLISAQPLAREGKIVTGSAGKWTESPLTGGREMQVGYYHIYAADMGEAISIAKRNPEFRYKRTAKIEVRPIKTAETETGFTYPSGS